MWAIINIISYQIDYDEQQNEFYEIQEEMSHLYHNDTYYDYPEEYWPRYIDPAIGSDPEFEKN